MNLLAGNTSTHSSAHSTDLSVVWLRNISKHYKKSNKGRSWIRCIAPYGNKGEKRRKKARKKFKAIVSPKRGAEIWGDEGENARSILVRSRPEWQAINHFQHPNSLQRITWEISPTKEHHKNQTYPQINRHKSHKKGTIHGVASGIHT